MHAVPLEMIPVVMDLGLTALRYPGGAWGDSVNIKPFQIDMFLDFCNQMGALPTISVRLWGGTPEQAADLVRYTNVEKEYGVIYWSIGNEPTLYEEDTGEVYDTVRFNQEWRAIAEAMKAEDPNIKLMGPELHQWEADLETTLKDSSGRDWMTEFLKANGDLVDVVTVHRYPLWKPVGSPTIQEMRDNTQEWPQLVTYLDGLIQEITGRGIPIAFTEVNSSPTGAIGQESSPDSFYNAIWYADVLGKLIQEDVFMVNHWVISQRSTGHGLIQGTNIRPTLYTFQIYKHFGNQQVYTASDLADVTVYAAKRQDETLTIMVINLSDVEQEVPLKVKGVQPSKADVWLLDSSHNAENLGEQSFTSDNIITLPAQSVTLYAIAP
jgi:alpha-L-arabinofuranosidase